MRVTPCQDREESPPEGAETRRAALDAEVSAAHRYNGTVGRAQLPESVPPLIGFLGFDACWGQTSAAMISKARSSPAADTPGQTCALRARAETPRAIARSRCPAVSNTVPAPSHPRS